MPLSILVLGGLGFVGRNFVIYAVENNIAENIRVIDKNLPETAYLNERTKKAFKKVEVLQRNLTNPASVKDGFTRANGEEFDYVFNFAGETKYSQSEEIYQERVYNLSTLCAKEAVKRNIKAFVELSTAEVYDSDKNPSTEDAKIAPWTLVAKYKYKAEEELRKMEGLNLIILRPAIVYGPGSLLGITPRLIMGRVYKKLEEEMQLLWSESLRLNTVHVEDVARASWHVVNWFVENGKVGSGEIFVFNLADSGDTTQEVINIHIRSIFGIKTGFAGTIASNFAKLNIESVTEDTNEKHLAPWAEILRDSRVKSSPLTPYLDKELLYNNALSVNGLKITKVTGFEYTVPEVTEAKLVEIIEDYKELKIWPRD